MQRRRISEDRGEIECLAISDSPSTDWILTTHAEDVPVNTQEGYIALQNSVLYPSRYRVIRLSVTG